MHKVITISLLIVLFFASCSLFNPSSSKLYTRSIKTNPQYDAIIVPGVPFIEPSWDNVMWMRVSWAVILYKTGIAKNLILSGSAVYSPYVEAKIMRLYAEALGVPKENLFIEERAEHSTENIWYGFHLAKKQGFKTIALATDPFQTNMLYRFCMKHTKGIGFLPVNYDSLKTVSREAPIIEYQGLKILDFIPLPERESFWKRLRGTRGKHINYKEFRSK